MPRAALLGLLAIASCERIDELGPARTRRIDLDAPRATVELIDPGAAPRAPLRWRWQVGARATFEESYWYEGAYGASPLEYLRADSEVVAQDAAGDFREVEIILAQGERPRAGVAPDPSGAPPRMVGARHELWITPTGEIHDAQLIAPIEMDTRELAQEQIEDAIVFPREDVGDGARWRTTIRQGDARATLEVTLVRRAGDRAELRTQYVAARELPGGVHDQRTGTLDQSVDLAGPLSTMHGTATSVVTEHGRETARYTLTSDVVPLSR